MQHHRDIHGIVRELQTNIINEFETSFKILGREASVAPYVGVFSEDDVLRKKIQAVLALKEKLNEKRRIADTHGSQFKGEKGDGTFFHLLMRKFKVGECGELASNLSLDLTKKRIAHYQVSVFNTDRTDGHSLLIFSTNESLVDIDVRGARTLSDLLTLFDDNCYLADPLLDLIFPVKNIDDYFNAYMNNHEYFYLASIFYNNEFDSSLAFLAELEKKADEEWEKILAEEAQHISASQEKRRVLQDIFPPVDRESLKKLATSVFDPQSRGTEWKCGKNMLWIELPITTQNKLLLIMLKDHFVSELKANWYETADVQISKVAGKQNQVLMIQPASAIHYINAFCPVIVNQPALK